MSTSPGVPYVEVTDLVRWFEGVHAVDGVSFAIPSGHVVGLIGANGAGKTTAMRILATLDTPDRGVVRIGGTDVVEKPNDVRQRIGWMPDNFGAYSDMTVADYLDFFGRAHGLRGSDLSQRVQEITAFTDLGPLAKRTMNKLSKGQTQRLSLARTLINNPDFLILDEPAAGLDPKARLEFKNLIRVLRDQGKTILISSHILSELGEMCDSLIFMDRGRVMHHGDTHSLLSTAAGEATSIIEISVHGPVAPLLEWLSLQSGWKLLEERRSGARAEFTGVDPAAVSTELRRLVNAGVLVTDFHREVRRLDEAFVAMLREPPPLAQTANPSSSPTQENKS